MTKKSRLHVYGGFAGQLNGLAYAYYMRDVLGIHVVLVLHSGGSSFRTPEIIELASDFNIVEVDDFSELTDNFNYFPWSRACKFFRRKMLGFQLRMGIQVHAGALNLEKLSRIKSWSREIYGWQTDWRIIWNSLPMISRVLAKEKSSDFMSEAGTDRGISIHWRLGDYLLNDQSNSFHGVISPDSILNVVELIDPNCDLTIKIFSDSIEIAREKLGPLLKDRKFIFESRDIKSDLIEMSRCSYFIGSHSSVSIWCAAALISKGFASNIYLPDRWSFGDLDFDLKNVTAFKDTKFYKAELVRDL